MKAMSAELMLESTEPSIFIIEDRTRKDIVIGVPHHAPAGKEELPCPEHSHADENAGFLGRHLAERLDCCSVIACNYTIDVNKHLRSDYTMQIASWRPQVLVEIHGHGGKAARNEIEISCGSQDHNGFSNGLATKLTDLLSNNDELRDIRVCGDYDTIRFKASSTITISDGRWLAYHIELPPSLRKPKSGSTGKPDHIGYAFCELLAQSLLAIHGERRSTSA